MDLDAVVQERINADTSFQDSLEKLSDEEKETALNTKKAEVAKVVFTELNDKATKAEQIAKDQKLRAEKAEKEAKEKPGSPTDDRKEEVLSPKDLYALSQAKVHIDDYDDVVEAAKVLKKPLHEALQHEVVKGILEKKEKHRVTARATNDRPQRPSNKAATEAEVHAEAMQGKIPEKGSPEAEALFRARRGIKK